jgi:UDP-2,4-diacetamido-2,4,6-trideoxy-beta-L-altropyranose hydrolase
MSGISNKKIVFRVDGGSKKVENSITKRGMGHVTRCLAIANELKKNRNLEILFITHGNSEGLNRILDAGFLVKEIPIGIKPEKESNFIINFLKEFKPHLVIVDSLDTNSNFMKKIKELGAILLSIDDLGNGRIYSDILIYNLVKPPKSYRLKQKHYSGPSYVPLNNKIKEKFEKKIRKIGKNILVSFGASDPGGFTLRTIKTLDKTNEDYNVTVIVGAAFNQNEKLKKLLKNVKKKYNLKFNVSQQEFVKMLQKSDMAITSGGLTVYELAATGTPGIVLCQNEHENSNIFEIYGFVIKLGLGKLVPENKILSAIESLSKDKKLRREMSKKGRNLVDGKGVERIGHIIIRELNNHLG